MAIATTERLEEGNKPEHCLCISDAPLVLCYLRCATYVALECLLCYAYVIRARRKRALVIAPWLGALCRWAPSLSLRTTVSIVGNVLDLHGVVSIH